MFSEPFDGNPEKAETVMIEFRIHGAWPKSRASLDHNRQSGAVTVEFFMMSALLILVFLLILQLGFIYHAKLVLNYAVFEAARKGAVNHAQVSVMRNELGIRLAPLYKGDGSRRAALLAMASSSVATRDTSATQLTILNPTPEAFDDWGKQLPDRATRVIPNAHLRHRSNQIGLRSGLNLQDANLLKLKVVHGYDLRIPLVARLIARSLLIIDPKHAPFYLRNKFPLTSVATVRMQSDAWESEILHAASAMTPGDSDDSATGTDSHPQSEADLVQVLPMPEQSLPISPDDDTSIPDAAESPTNVDSDETQTVTVEDVVHEEDSLGMAEIVECVEPRSNDRHTAWLISASAYEAFLAK